MSTLYFFGDSWPAERGEYDTLMRSNFDSYPTMIGKKLEKSIINLSQPGTSQEHMLWQLVNSDARTGDHAIFSLTAPSRRMLVDEYKKLHHYPVDPFKLAVNDENDNWNSAKIVFILYFYCIAKGISPWFINTFNSCYNNSNELWQMVPDHVWILDKGTCVVKELFDKDFFSVNYTNDEFFKWLQTNNDRVKKYISPCQDHPNLEGRLVIAEFISNFLFDKI